MSEVLKVKKDTMGMDDVLRVLAWIEYHRVSLESFGHTFEPSDSFVVVEQELRQVSAGSRVPLLRADYNTDANQLPSQRYLEQVVSLMSTWSDRIDKDNMRPNDAIAPDVQCCTHWPQDLAKVLTEQISMVARELSGHTVVEVVTACSDVLTRFLDKRLASVVRAELKLSKHAR